MGASVIDTESQYQYISTTEPERQPTQFNFFRNSDPVSGQESKPVESRAQHRSDAAVLDSRDLLRGQQEVRIQHDGQIYRLRLTRTGKLILHK